MGRGAAGRCPNRARRPDLPAARDGARGLSGRRVPAHLPGIVDSHAHLQHSAFDADRDAVVERAVAAGLARIVVPGWDVASSEAALELATRHAPVVVAAVGVHPHDAAVTDERAWATLEALVADSRCVAVGEIGLDYYREHSPRDVQRDAFERQLDLAARRDLPVLVHDREAHADVTDALLRWPGRDGADARGVLHAFSGDAGMATTLAAAGYLVSFALPVAFRSATASRDAAVALFASSIVVETDSPYLGPDSARRNEPITTLRVATEVARLRGVEPEVVARDAGAALGRMLPVA